MAYNNSQLIENLQVQNLIFIPSNNSNIPAGYALYIHSNGQTYWAPALDALSLSTFSTSVYSYINKNDSTLQGQINKQSTQLSYQSTSIANLFDDVETLSTSVSETMSTNYSLTISTLYGISSFAAINNQISTITGVVQTGLSTLSTALYLQNTSTYNSLLNIINVSVQSAYTYTDASISSLAFSTAYKSDLSTFSSIITRQLLSSITGLQSYVDLKDTILFYETSTLAVSTMKNYYDISTLNSQVSSLITVSTSMSNVTNTWISTFVSTSQALQDLYIYKSISSLSSIIGLNQQTELNHYKSVSNSLSTVSLSTTQNSVNISTLNSKVALLDLEYSTLTTTGLTVSIYNSFIQLEQYTSTIVVSTYNSFQQFEADLAYSTYIQNVSISVQFFSSYVENLYESTISATTKLTTDYLSSLFSTYYTVGVSTIYGRVVSTNTSVLSSYTSTLFLLLSTTNGLYTSTATYSYNSTMNQATNVYNDYIVKTNTDYINYANSLVASGGLSTLYTNTTYNLNGSNYTATLDFSTYRHFEINVYNVNSATSNYSIQYDPSKLSNTNYVKGTIFINVSTPNQLYTRNDGKLQFDVYRWGIPTTVWGNFYPTIENSQYTLQYEYTILRANVYTNLVAIYPILYVSHIDVSPVTKGSAFTVQWSTYNGFNYNKLPGAPNFDPTVSITTITDFATRNVFGPFPMSSITTLVAPATMDRYTVIVGITGQQEAKYNITSNIF